MIGYVTLGTNNFDAATKFYDELFKTIGADRQLELETFVAWGTGRSSPAVSITKPFDGNAASVGNGVMVAIALKAPDQVDEFYAKALSLGATDEGVPGKRYGNLYVGYFRDLDGNKLNGFCFVSE